MRFAALVVALAVAGAFAAPVQAAMSSDQVAAAISERYGVKVLKVTEAERDGRAVFRVTVMRGGGNVNGAWQVTTVEVDPETGELVRQFRHGDSGYSLSGAPQHRTNVQPPDAAERGFVWR